jgi:hypothetical protein
VETAVWNDSLLFGAWCRACFRPLLRDEALDVLGARGVARREKPRSLLVWQRGWLNSRALALLLTRRNGAQRPRSDRHHRPLLLFSGQVLDQFAISFF